MKKKLHYYELRKVEVECEDTIEMVASCAMCDEIVDIGRPSDACVCTKCGDGVVSGDTRHVGLELKSMIASVIEVGEQLVREIDEELGEDEERSHVH